MKDMNKKLFIFLLSIITLAFLSILLSSFLILIFIFDKPQAHYVLLKMLAITGLPIIIPLILLFLMSKINNKFLKIISIIATIMALVNALFWGVSFCVISMIL